MNAWSVVDSKIWDEVTGAGLVLRSRIRPVQEVTMMLRTFSTGRPGKDPL